MSRRLMLSTLLCTLMTSAIADTGAAAAPAGHQPGEEAAVLATVDRFMAAISANDLEALAALQAPDGMTYRARAVEGGGWEVVGRPNSYWVDPARKGGPVVRERYWNATILVRGSIALVWAPYEFWRDGRTSHCGVDTFDLVKVDGRWRIANMMWTVEPEACGELRPRDAAAVRPTG